MANLMTRAPEEIFVEAFRRLIREAPDEEKDMVLGTVQVWSSVIFDDPALKARLKEAGASLRAKRGKDKLRLVVVK